MIPVNEPLLDGNELKYVTECITTTWISSSGQFIDKFERQWADYCGMKHGIAVCNGTIALELAVSIYNFPQGSEIILPSFTIISCAQAIIKAGCIPVLVDCDAHTFCMDVSQIEGRITDKTVAIMAVHIYGHPVDMDRLRRLATKYKLLVIEDAAECHGGEVLVDRDSKNPKWRRSGGLGDISCFSFYANKIITTGEGGMILTNDDSVAKRLRSHRNLCFLPEQRFLHREMGGNYRFTNIQAAIGLAQLEKIEEFIRRKRDMAAMYKEGLSGLPLQLPIELKWAKSVYWMYAVVLDDSIEIQANEIAKRLEDRGIQTRPFFLGMHEQPVFLDMGYFKGDSFPVTEKIARRGFYLPSGTAVTDEQIDSICKEMKEVFNN